MKQKQFYSAPEAEVFKFLQEGFVCQSYGLSQKPGQDLELDDDDRDYGDF